MKITVTGSLGHISKPLAEKLVKAGHTVTLVSSSEDKTSAIRALGATAAIGSVNDAGFLTDAFKGADAVYTMVPPDFGVNDYREYYNVVGRNYAAAIKNTGIKKVVNLSSIGADLPSGTGPIAGLHDVENILNDIDGIDVKHLRPGAFYVNFYGNIDMIRHMNIIGANYGADTMLVMVHPLDIADAAAAEFENKFTGKSVRYVVSDERSASEVATILGKAIGKPDLKWVEFTDQQALEGMEKAGFPAPIARTFAEMGTATRSGIVFSDYKKVRAPVQGKIKLEDFAVEFAGKY